MFDVDLPDYCFLAATGPTTMLHIAVFVGAGLLAVGVTLALMGRRSMSSALALAVVLGLSLSFLTPSPAEASSVVRVDLPECQPTGEQKASSSSSSRSSESSGSQSAETDDGSLRISARDLSPGDLIVLSGNGYKPGTKVQLTMFSEPTDLLPGGAVVSEAGRFAVEVEVPEVEDGSHTITAEGVGADGDERSGSLGVSLDGTPPEIDLESFTFVPNGLTVVEPDDLFSFEIAVRDASGIERTGFTFADITTEDDGSGGLQFRSSAQRDNFCGQEMTRKSGPDADGWEIWQATCTVDEDWINGTYQINFYADDPFFLSNFTDSYNLGEPLPLQRFTVSGANADYLPPELEVEVIPTDEAHVDGEPFEPGDSFTIQITADDVSGVARVGFTISEFMTFYDEFTDQDIQQPIQRDSFCGQDLTPDELKEVWSVECTVTAFWLNGEFDILPFAEDRLGNLVYLYSEDDGIGSFSVTGASSDRTGPEIISISPQSGRFTVGDRVTLSVVVDDPSQIDLVQVGIRDIDRGIDRFFCGFDLGTSSTNQTRQTWTQTCRVNEFWVNGTYELIAVARDKISNWTGSNNFPNSPTRGQITIF